MAGKLESLIVSIGADVSGALKGFSETEDGLFSLNKAGLAASAGTLGAGVAMQKTLDDTRDMRASLGRTRVSMGLSGKEANSLARDISNVTFPLEDATATMDILARQGVDTKDDMKELAGAADLIADATGSSAASIAGSLAPTLRGIDGDLSGLTESADAFTLASRTTGLSVEDIASTLDRSSTEIKGMGLSTADATGLIALYGQATGKSGRRLRQDFDKALREADGDLGELTKTLGLGDDALGDWNKQLDNNEGVAKKSADAANESFSAMDKLRHAFDEAKFAASGFLSPLSGLAPVLQAAGSAGLFMSTVNMKSMIPSLWGAATAGWAAVAPWLPLILALTVAIGVGILLWQNWEEIFTFIHDHTEWVLDAVSGFVSSAMDFVTGAFGKAVDFIKGLFGKMMGFVEENWLAFVAFPLWAVKKVVAFFKTEAGGKILGGIKSAFTSAVDYVKGLPGEFLQFGKDIVLGLVDGITSMAGDAVDAVKSVGGSVVSGAKGIFGIGSPSKEFKDIGQDNMAGLKIGHEGMDDLIQDPLKGISRFSSRSASGSGGDRGVASLLARILAALERDDGAAVVLDGKEVGRVLRRVGDRKLDRWEVTG